MSCMRSQVMKKVDEMMRELPVEWTRSGTAFGLLRAIFSAPDTRCFDTVTLEVDGAAVWSAPGAFHDDGRVHLNIHTHLLGNGHHEIAIRAVHDGGVYRSAAKYLIKNEGPVAETVRDALRTHGAALAFFGDCDSGRYAAAYRDTVVWVDRPDAPERIESMLRAGDIDRSEADMLLHFVRDGYVVFDDALPDSMIDRANSALDHAVESGYQGYVYGESTRLEQMHVVYPEIRDIWLYPPVHRFLSLVFGAKSQPCQSLVYLFGSQQDAHQDTIHLTPFPAGMMCGVWFALEDVREGAGELVVYPSSHRLPRVYMQEAGCEKVRGDWSEFGRKVVGRWSELLRENAMQPIPYLAKRGQILVWHENLMHAGTIRRDKSLSRRSVVTHNFAHGAIVYYDSSGNVGHVHEA